MGSELGRCCYRRMVREDCCEVEAVSLSAVSGTGSICLSQLKLKISALLCCLQIKIQYKVRKRSRSQHRRLVLTLPGAWLWRRWLKRARSHGAFGPFHRYLLAAIRNQHTTGREQPETLESVIKCCVWPCRGRAQYDGTILTTIFGPGCEKRHRTHAGLRARHSPRAKEAPYRGPFENASYITSLSSVRPEQWRHYVLRPSSSCISKRRTFTLSI